MEKRRYVFIFLIAVIAAVLFYSSNEGLRGYLRSYTSLAKEVKSPPDSIDLYNIASQAPFKYRLLFPAIIKGSYAAVTDESDPLMFYHTYKFWSLVFYGASACAMFWLLSVCGFADKFAFAGAVVFLLLPAMAMAFTLPVHTREDTLAYTVFFTGLVFLLRGQRVAFLLVCIAGALTRETLLLLPLLYFFFAGDRNFVRRFAIAGLPGLVWIGIRLTMGHETYDVWEGLKWNLSNPEQVVGFLFITFNFCWIPFVLHLLFFRSNVEAANDRLRFFYRSAPFALAVILVTTFIGGIYNEIRLLYLFSPWMIAILIDFVSKHRETLGYVVRSGSFRFYAAAALFVCTALLYLFLRYQEKIIVPGKWAVPYHLWIIFSVGYVFVFLLFLPLSWRVFSLKRSAK